MREEQAPPLRGLLHTHVNASNIVSVRVQMGGRSKPPPYGVCCIRSSTHQIMYVAWIIDWRAHLINDAFAAKKCKGGGDFENNKKILTFFKKHIAK